MKPLWPHQKRGFDEATGLIDSGTRRICVTSPTGGGKSRLIAELILWARNKNWPTVVYSPRRLLTDQFMDVMVEHRIPFGVRQATYDDHLNLDADVQISSAMTEKSRLKMMKWDRLHDAKLVLVDEAHMQANGVCADIIRQHSTEGAAVVGFTATPLGVDHLYQELVVAGTNSELRKTGALLPCLVYDGGHMALDKVKRHAVTGEFNQTEIRKMGYVQQIYGSVLEMYKRENPDRKPAILFAPGVAESKWFVDRMNAEGVTAAHIDGEDIYRDGTEFKKKRNEKDRLFDDVKSGNIQVLCNRFLAREGINIPELFYTVLACPIGSLSSYIQTVGRVVRAHPSLTEVKLADHGGNARRHGSPNEDRDWKALWKHKESAIVKAREERIANGKTEPGTACPECGMVWRKLPDKCACCHELKKLFACPHCGHEHPIFPSNRKCDSCGADIGSIRKKRVIESDGTLKLVPDEAFKQKHVKQLPETQKMWDAAFWSAFKNKKDRTFVQCWAWFCKKHWERFRCAPPRNLQRMPLDELDWWRRVCDVQLSELRGMQK